MNLTPFKPFLGDLEAMTSTMTDGSKDYVQPALKSLGTVSLVVLREVISPASFRNAESEVTDIDVGGHRHIRAVANKFKFGERARGLQILRHFNAGGNSPQNKTAFSGSEKPSARFDLNAFVFGDSANHGTKVLPVKASAQYSDAISIQDYAPSVDATFHNRASEDGSLFDAARKENSNNIFERHFIKPGTALLQVISFNGRTAPAEAISHLLLSMGLAGAYGGGTSIYGINVRNRVVGLYGGRFERDVASPYVAIAKLREAGIDRNDVDAVHAALAALYAEAYPTAISGDAVEAMQKDQIAALEAGDAEMKAAYAATAGKLVSYFDLWFEGIGK
jgi:CRISPR type I-D-associated protein Csc2